MSEFRIAHCRLLDEGLEIGFEGLVRRMTFPWHWLRDNSNDAYTFDPETRQRRIDSFSIPQHLTGVVEVNAACDALSIVWSDDSPRSVFSAFELAKAAAGTTLPDGPSGVARIRPSSDRTRELWDRHPPPEALNYTDYMEVIGSDDALLKWLDDIHRYGFACLEGVPLGEVAVATLANRIGYVRTTIFGGVWPLEAELTEHADTAYNDDFLTPHTDATYMHDAPGLQIFSCQEAAEVGGESILVDGFAIADRIAATDLENLDILARVHVPGHYLEPGVDLQAKRPAFRFDSAGVLQQVSFNNSDRGDMLMAPHHYQSFVRAYTALHNLTVDQSRWLGFAWEPGELLAIDNWRMLHGRRKFTGKRSYFGCYVNQEDFASKRRVLRAAREAQWSKRPVKS